ncbi:MAG: DUF1648 domain-containing protein [Armatimonadota bacterium]
MKPSERPRLEIVPTRLDAVLDAVSAAGVLITIALFVAVWDKLPGRIPTHFGLSGAPNQWGPRSALLLFVIVPLVLHIGMTILSRMPWSYNYPTKVTEENYKRLYRLGRGMMLWLRTETVWLFAVLGVQTVRVALGAVKTLGPGLVIVPLVVIYGTVIYYIVMMYRARRSVQA